MKTISFYCIEHTYLQMLLSDYVFFIFINLYLYYLPCLSNFLVFLFGFQPIVRLAFVGESEYLLSISHGSKPHLSVWSMSKLAASWSYRLQIEGLKKHLLL